MGRENQESRAKRQEVSGEAPGADNPHLNPALADKYRVVLTHCRYLQNTCVGDVDLTTLTEEQAAQLADDESQPYVERIS